MRHVLRILRMACLCLGRTSFWILICVTPFWWKLHPRGILTSVPHSFEFVQPLSITHNQQLHHRLCGLSLMFYATIIWLWTVCLYPFDTSSYGFYTISTISSAHVHVCYVLHGGSYLLFNKVSYFWIFQIWVCVLNWFTVELVHGCVLDIYHLHGLG